MSEIPVLPFPDPISANFPFWIGKLELAPEWAMTTTPRCHNFYMAVWITAGTGQHFVDFRGHEIKPFALHFVRPGQLQYWRIDKPLQGHLLVFAERIFRIYGLDQFFNQLGFLTLSSAPPLFNFSAEEANTIQHFIREIGIAATDSNWGQEMALLSWLNLLLLEGQRRSISANKPAGLANGEQLTHEFLRLVDKQATSKHSLTAYATQLGVTVGHLTETVKAVQGQPAGAILRQHLALEAKRLLVHTDMSVAQVADSLNFNDPSYFGRFFKRETTRTPRSFRADFNR